MLRFPFSKEVSVALTEKNRHCALFLVSEGVRAREPGIESLVASSASTHSGIKRKHITKSKMADENSSILFDSVQFVLSNWSVLQLAVENGFGGVDTTEKAKWMVDVINQVLRDNGMLNSLSHLEEIDGYELFR